MSSSSVFPLVSTANSAITAPTTAMQPSWAKTIVRLPPEPMMAPTTIGPRMTPSLFHTPPNDAPRARLRVGYSSGV